MVKRWLAMAAVLGGVMALPMPVSMAQAPSAERCAAIGPASERLQCYDSIFRSGQFTGESAGGQAPEQGLWTSGVEISQIEGTELPFATVQSEQLIPALSGGRAPARLTILCVDGETAIQFGFAGSPMGTPTSNSGPLTLQYDRQPPRSQSADLSPDRVAIGFFETDEARPIIDQLLQTQRLFVRATPPSQRSVTVSFQMEGIEAALEPVREACGW
ncbi:type VI secretion system-associated protein TagO [Pelagibacterium luteolum]|uniref:Type VI secretion system protein VasI n=1 Tax=Pelagibacterium luteolum TaxID=440168 RepID=A0A1G7TQD8_9HYPH|nr:type VI secretion system-associated protein TagO [Pelagibacterium luteolum]SDG37536.1 type VI secretion system protein VasI [Pelagibacterium luteolum]